MARFAGMAKGVLAGGHAASFGVEAATLTQLHVVAYNLTLQAVGSMCMAGITWMCVTETEYGNEDDTIAPTDFQAKESIQE